jgi:hypothetical protein
MATTVMMRIREDTHKLLREVAEEEGATRQDVLARAVDAYWRARFFEQMNAAYTALRNDPEAWEEELAERRAWDGTLMDGIESESAESLESAAHA